MKSFKHETVEAAAEILAGNNVDHDGYWCWIKYPENEKWCMVSPCHRGSDVLTRSNWAVMQRELAKVATFSEPPDRFETVKPGQTAFIGYASHDLVGRVDQLHMRVYEPDGTVTPVFRKYCELMARMEDYPVLDDDHLSELEGREAVEQIYRVGRGKTKDGVREGWAYDVMDFLCKDGQASDYDVCNMWEEILDAMRELDLIETVQPDEGQEP